MKVLAVLVLLSACCACVKAKPGLIIASSTQYHAQDRLGQYSYGYSNPQSAKAEVKTADGITQGSYSYIDAEGKLQSVHYTADEINGFRVAATNLPSPVLPLIAAPAPSTITQNDPNAEKEIPEEAAVEAKTKSSGAPVLRTSLLTYAPLVTTHIATPGFAYSYGYPQYLSTYFNHLTPITYAATPYLTHHITTPDLGQLAALPIAPAETPEVAKARAEHVKAHEQAKARNL